MKNISLTVLVLLLIYVLFVPTCSYLKSNRTLEDSLKTINSRYVDKTCFKMYECMEKYSEEYQIPKHIFYNVAYLESRYKGPYDSSYKHNVSSKAGALGPMQIMPSTAKFIYGKIVPKNKLKNDFEFNVELSAKLLNYLYQKYNDWSLVCGCYNTGRPIINKYAKFCVNKLNYQDNWEKPNY